MIRPPPRYTKKPDTTLVRFSQKSINVKNDKGLPAQLEHFFVVDEEKLNKLSVSQLA